MILLTSRILPCIFYFCALLEQLVNYAPLNISSVVTYWHHWNEWYWTIGNKLLLRQWRAYVYTYMGQLRSSQGSGQMQPQSKHGSTKVVQSSRQRSIFLDTGAGLCWHRLQIMHSSRYLSTLQMPHLLWLRLWRCHSVRPGGKQLVNPQLHCMHMCRTSGDWSQYRFAVESRLCWSLGCRCSS